MNRRSRFLLRRGAFALLAAWVVLTVVYAVIELTPDPNLSVAVWSASAHAGGQSAEQAKQAYLATHGGVTGPITKYVDYLTSVATLDWGNSYTLKKPVLGVLVDRLRVTALYLVPALVVSSVVGVAYGAYSAMNRGSVLDRLAEFTTYLGFGVPNVFLAVSLPIVLVEWHLVSGGIAPPYRLEAYQHITVPLMKRMVFPAFIICTTLLAGIAHYTRSETAERLGEEYVKLVHAKGARTRRIARHALRNAALPLVALTYSEFLAVVAFHVFVVENALATPGIGRLLFTAIRGRDMPVVMGVTLLIVFAGIVGNFVQDVLSAALDPRLQD